MNMRNTTPLTTLCGNAIKRTLPLGQQTILARQEESYNLSYATRCDNEEYGYSTISPLACPNPLRLPYMRRSLRHGQMSRLMTTFRSMTNSYRNTSRLD